MVWSSNAISPSPLPYHNLVPRPAAQEFIAKFFTYFRANEAGQEGDGEARSFALGDIVKVIKPDSTIRGECGEVIDPDWHQMVKLRVTTGTEKGKTKSYLPTCLESVSRKRPVLVTDEGPSDEGPTGGEGRFTSYEAIYRNYACPVSREMMPDGMSRLVDKIYEDRTLVNEQKLRLWVQVSAGSEASKPRAAPTSAPAPAPDPISAPDIALNPTPTPTPTPTRP